MEMVVIKTISSFVGGYTVKAQYNIRQYYEFSDVFVSREQEENGNGHVYAYGYFKDNYGLQWHFPSNDVIGIRPIN